MNLEQRKQHIRATRTQRQRRALAKLVRGSTWQEYLVAAILFLPSATILGATLYLWFTLIGK